MCRTLPLNTVQWSSGYDFCFTATAEELEGFAKMVALFKTQAPDWDGLPLTPETSVRLMREVIAKAGPQESGAFVSQYGNQKWL